MQSSGTVTHGIITRERPPWLCSGTHRGLDRDPCQTPNLGIGNSESARRIMAGPHRAEIGLILYPGAQLSAVHGMTDLFRVAAKTAGGDKLRVTHWHSGTRGDMTVAWDSDPGTPPRPTYIVVPLTLTALPEPPLMARITDWMARQHAAGATLGSVCSGIFVLAETGLLKGRSVATHYGCTARLTRDFPDVRIAADRTLVDNGDIITAGGFLSWLDVGLQIISRTLGPEVAQVTARRLSADPHLPQSPPPAGFAPNLGHGDDAIARVQRSIHRADGREASLAALASEAGLEQRTFLRRFAAATGHTPLDYCRQIRIARAKEWLESSNRTVAAIGHMVGYEDAKAFARAFRRVTGVSPLAWRRAAAAASGSAEILPPDRLLAKPLDGGPVRSELVG